VGVGVDEEEVEVDDVAAGHFVEQAARAQVGSRGSGSRRRSRWEGVAEEEGRGRVRTGDMGVHAWWLGFEQERRRWR
jgi:hypothetical protein